MTHTLAFTILFLVLGCKGEAPSVQPPPAKSRTYSDGTNTWTLGAVTWNGTNVPLTNVTVGAVTNEVSH